MFFANVKPSIEGFENEDLANATILEFENGVLGTVLLSDKCGVTMELGTHI